MNWRATIAPVACAAGNRRLAAMVPQAGAPAMARGAGPVWVRLG